MNEVPQEHTKTVIPFKREFLTEYIESPLPGMSKFPAVDWKLLSINLSEDKVKYVRITITEIVDWDMAPMRKFFHGVVVPAFVKKYNESSKHPLTDETKQIVVHFINKELKLYLKCKFLGFNKKLPSYYKWVKLLGLDNPIKTFEDFFKLNELVGGIADEIKVTSTEGLTPEQYMNFINECEKYYFELFHETYDIREKPVLGNTDV